MHKAQPPAAVIITTFADLHDRVVRNLHECGLALASVTNRHSALDVKQRLDETEQEIVLVREAYTGRR